MDWTLFIDIGGTLIGLVYLWLEYRANIWLWLFGVIMPVVNAWLYYDRGLYADFAMESYYIVAAVYGYLMWRYKGRSGPDKGDARRPREGEGIVHMNLVQVAGALVAVGVIWWGIHYVLVHYTDSRVPVLDSLTTATSIVAMWALAQKYVEQWLMWFVVDAICLGLYFYKGIPFHAMLYGFYTVMAIVGYRRWCRYAREGNVAGSAA